MNWVYFPGGLKLMVSVSVQRRLFTGCLILTLFALAGCGGSGLATVEGKVTVDGQPATAGRVVFRSADGKSTIIAKIAPDGSYRALDVPQEEMKVTVAGLTRLELSRVQRGVKGKSPSDSTAGAKGKKSSDSKALAKEIESSPKIPEKYQDPDASGLTCTVKSGTNTYNIDISSK